ncbi:unnamed protein product, partial [Heterosigma akashiwo]
MRRTRSILLGFVAVTLSLTVCQGWVFPNHGEDLQEYFEQKEYINTILARPTDKSMTVSLMSSYNINSYIQYGTSPGEYEEASELYELTAHSPEHVDLVDLEPNTRYYYRVVVSDPTKKMYKAGKENSFVTAKLPGNSFKFAILADSHFQEQPAFEYGDLYLNTLKNIEASNADFLFDMGDTFMANKLIDQNVNGLDEDQTGHKDVDDLVHAHRAYYGKLLDKMPMLSIRGNQDGEFGFTLDDEEPLSVWTATARKKYFPQPNPDYKFYDANTQKEPYLNNGWVEDYFSFRWGDALFVTLDPYWYTRGNVHDAWDWTLGREQYNWFANVLRENSGAPPPRCPHPPQYKFVLSHNLLGAQGASQRGGAEWARFYEWGGHEEDGTDVFRARRPGFGGGDGVPVHDLLVKHGVDIFFHGHDHFYARQEVDGVVYQLCPKPDEKRLEPFENRDAHNYQFGVQLPGAGHLEINVDEDHVAVLYVKSFLDEEVGE